MKKNIWIINHYAGSMYFDKGGRHYWFAKYLKRAGYNPTVFVSNSKHGVRDQWIESQSLWVDDQAKDIDTPFVFVKSSLYEGNGKERIKNMISFYGNLKKCAKQYAQQKGKPDIILASSVHPLTMVAGIQLAKHFGVKCICEVRDLWPEAIVAYSTKLTKNSLISKVLYRGERWIYKKADAVIFTQEGGPDYVKEKKWDTEQGGPINNSKLYHINNGVDLEAFDQNLMQYQYEDEDMNNPNTFKVVYAGAIRRINNLGLIVDAAKLISNPNIRFIIFGSGDELESLKKRVEEEHVQNVIFKGRVNKQFIPSIVSKADLNLVHWEMNPLLKVGESYNKAFEYFAAGKPVFYTIRPGYSIVEKYNCGRITEGYDPKDIAKGIECMACLDSSEIETLSANSRKAAENYDFKNLTKELIHIVETR